MTTKETTAPFNPAPTEPPPSPPALPPHPNLTIAQTLLEPPCPPEVRQAILNHVNRHYPETARPTRCPNRAGAFDQAKAACIQARHTYELNFHQQRPAHPATQSPPPPIDAVHKVHKVHPAQTTPKILPRSNPTLFQNPPSAIPNPPSNSTSPDVTPVNSTSFPPKFSPLQIPAIHLDGRAPASPTFDPLVPSTPQIPQTNPSPVLSTSQKSSSNSPLAHLSPDDHEKLCCWLDTMKLDDIVQRAAQPRPAGLALKTSNAALSRFNQKRALQQRLQNAVETIQSFQPPAQTPNLIPLLQQILDAQLLEDASQGLDPAGLRHLSRYLTRLKDQEIRQRALDLHQKRLAHHLQKWGYDIVQQTIARLDEINEIVADKKLTPRERFHKAWVKMVGPECAQMVQEANARYRHNHPNDPDTEPQPDLKCLQPKPNQAQVVRELLGETDPETEPDPTPPPTRKNPATQYLYDDEIWPPNSKPE